MVASQNLPMQLCYAVMLLWNATRSHKSPRLLHIAHLERVAFPEHANLELWLQI
jgi:hypothetical protein